MDRLMSAPGERKVFVDRIRGEAERARDASRKASPAPVADGRTAREHLQYRDVPPPPFYGTRTLRDIDLEKHCGQNFDLESLYRLSWGGSNVKGEEWERIVATEFAPRLERYQRLAETSSVLEPRVVYGYFPAAGSGNDVIVYDPNDHAREIARFPFTRQAGGEHLCLADYLREPVAGGPSDVIALQVVTMGRGVSRRNRPAPGCRRL